jgi:hypothetical protein
MQKAGQMSGLFLFLHFSTSPLLHFSTSPLTAPQSQAKCRFSVSAIAIDGGGTNHNCRYAVLTKTGLQKKGPV